MPTPVHDHRTIRRKERSPIVPKRGRESPEVRAVDLHRIDVEIPITSRREDDGLTVGRQRSLGVVALRVGQPLQIVAVGPRGVNVEVHNGPHIPLRAIRRGRASLSRVERARVQYPLVRLVVVSAGGAPQPVRYAPHVRPIDTHHVLLVATPFSDLTLEDEVGAIGREIGLGILPTKRELLQVCEETLPGFPGSRHGRGVFAGRSAVHREYHQRGHDPGAEFRLNPHGDLPIHRVYAEESAPNRRSQPGAMTNIGERPLGSQGAAPHSGRQAFDQKNTPKSIRAPTPRACLKNPPRD